MNGILRLAILNPILLRVVTAGGRRLRHAFTRWGYLGLLIMVVMIALMASASGTGSRSLSDYAKAASQVFAAISYVQLAMICLLAPVFCAAAITQERDSQTYNILLVTPLTNAQIVLGSLFSRLYYVVALLLSGAPVFAITLLYGGVTRDSIAVSFAIALSTALFTGSLAIAIAVFRLGSGKTVFWFYVFNAIYLVAVYMADQYWLGLDAGGNHHTTVLTSIHPFLALQSVVSPTAYPTPNHGSVAGYSSIVQWYLLYPKYAYVTITTVMSLAMVVPSAIVLRRIAQRSESGFWAYLSNVLRRGKEGKTRKARPVWQNPVAWREAATRAGFSGRGLTRWMTILAGLAAALVVLVLYYKWRSIAMAQEAPEDVLNGLADALQKTRYLILGLVIIEFSVALLVATNTSAAAVTKERESQTLDLLLVTPITSRYYIWGKLRGLVSFMLPFAAVPTITVLLVVLYDFAAGLHFAASGAPVYEFATHRDSMGHDVPRVIEVAAQGFWSRAMHQEWVVWPESTITLPVILTVMLSWACMLGLQLSLKWSRTIVAVMGSVGVLAGICSILGVCGVAAASTFQHAAPVVAAFSPFTAICMLIAPQEFVTTAFGPNAAYAGDMLWVGRLVVVISIAVAATVYCLIVWAMYRSMVKNFDMIIRRQHQ